MKRLVLLLAPATVPLVIAGVIGLVLLLQGSPGAAPQVAACDPQPTGIAERGSSQDSDLNPERQRIENLAALARVWGVVRYFHPYVASRDIDWDKALVDSLPQVAAVRSAAEMEAAITRMLSNLDDPATRVAAGPVRREAENLTASLRLTWASGDVAILKACYGDDADDGERQQALQEASQKARGVVFDLREGPTLPDDAYERALREALKQALPFVVSEAVTAPGEVYVKYVGYPAQAGGSSFYTRRFDKAPSDFIRPARESKAAPRLVFLAGGRTPNVFNLLGGIQSQANGSIVFSGSQEQADIAAGRVVGVALPFGLAAYLRTTIPEGLAHDVLIEPDNAAGGDEALERALSLARGKAGPAKTLRAESSVTARPLTENAYAEMTSPTSEYRLLALFRAWNVIHYFFPYLDLMDESWDDTLLEFIPRFETAEGEEAYVTTVAEFAARIGDSHVTIAGPGVTRVFGSALPGIMLSPVEGKNVVVRILDDEARQKDVSVGDVVTAVDGVPVETRAEELTKLLSGSTPQARRLLIARYLLRGQGNTPVRIELLKADGKSVSVSLTRTRQPQVLERSTPVFSVLPEGFGYIDLDRVTVNQLDEAFRMVQGTPGLILDMRGYPNGVFPVLPSYLGQRTGAGALFERPEPDPLSLASRKTTSFIQGVRPPGPTPYRGPVAVLINAEAISQAEHTLLHLEASRKVTFIGSATTGANGDVTTTVLPGGIVMTFTGQAVRHADGRQLQRVGVQPDIAVEPTIAGVRAGRDEVLEAAVAYLKGAAGD